MASATDNSFDRQVFDSLVKSCTVAALEIAKHREVVVASHVDADGLCAAGVICTALKRIGIEYNPLFFKQLDPAALDTISDLGPDMVIFTDLGSGMFHEISSLGFKSVIADHHRPSSGSSHRSGGIMAHINPHLYGADGATHLSGSGSAFLLARSISPDSDDLSGLAIVGAVGDLQDMAKGQLVGYNRLILDIGTRAGIISFGPDLRLFGRQTRPIFKMLGYSQDPYIPGLSGDEAACIAFLKELGIRQGGENWRRWIDLDRDEKGRIVSALVRRGLRSGISAARMERLVGEVYSLITEREGTELRDASEYSTLLNATARYGHSRVGLAVCMGDRDSSFEEAQLLLSQHRQNLINGLQFVKERGILKLSNIQYFDAGNAILDTIVGIVAGMSFQMADRSRPILAFAMDRGGNLKVSARGTQDLVRSGLDLAMAMSSSAKAVGGVGGGHNVAAGATIPEQARTEFLDMVDRIVGEQISKRKEKR